MLPLPRETLPSGKSSSTTPSECVAVSLVATLSGDKTKVATNLAGNSHVYPLLLFFFKAIPAFRKFPRTYLYLSAGRLTQGPEQGSILDPEGR